VVKLPCPAITAPALDRMYLLTFLPVLPVV
jgi:hypothetical protein